MARRDAGDGHPGGTPEVLLAVLHRAVVDHLLPGRERDLARGGVERVDGRARRRRESDARSPSQPPISSICTRASATVRKPSGRAELLGDAGEHPQVGQRAGVAEDGLEGPQPALPVDERAGLVGDRRDREDHVGGAGHVGLAQLEATTNRAASRAARVAAGSAVSSGSTPPMTSPPSSPAASGGHDRVGVAALGVGQVRRRPRRWRRRRGRRRRRPGGRRAAGSAGSRSRARPGHRRDAGPTPAGHRSSRPGRPPRSARPARWPAAHRRGSRRSCRRRTRPARRARRAPRPRRRAGWRPAGRPSCAGRARCTARSTRRGCPCGTPCAAAGRSRRPRPRARARRGRRSARSRGRRTRRGGGARPRRRGSAPPPRRAGGPGSRCRWCRARPARTCCRRRRPRR